MRKHKRFKIPIYHQFKMNIILTDNPVEEMSKLGYKDIEYEFDGMFVDKGEQLYIILDSNSIRPSLVAHECLHATFHILRYVEIPLTKESEEAYTYFHMYLIDECYKIIQK